MTRAESATRTLTAAEMDVLIADNCYSYAKSYERGYWDYRIRSRAVPPVCGPSREGYLAGRTRAVAEESPDVVGGL